MNLYVPYKMFWRHRKSLRNAVLQMLRARYAGSAVGLLWLVVGPVILLSLYALIYTVIFQVRPVQLSIEDYIFYIFSGLVPFISFSQALSAGAASLAADRALLLNKIFPAEMIPAREVFAAGTFMIVGALIVIFFKCLMGHFYWTWLLLPPLILLFAMMVTGVVWGLSIANLVVKDVQQLIGYMVIVLLISSPIAYTPDMVPQSLQLLLYANPFAYYVQAFQAILVLGTLPPLSILVGCLFFAFVSFHGMFSIFALGKRVIADNV